MTAEIFLAAFLGCLLAFVTFSVLVNTVYIPVRLWILRRRLRTDQPVVDMEGIPPCRADQEQAFVASMERHHATQGLLIAALDQEQGQATDVLLAAAQRYRSATSPQEASVLRSVRHLFAPREKNE